MPTNCPPAARTADLVMTELDGELLVYDLRAHHLHRLNAPTVAVWRCCDGRSNLAAIARRSGLDEAPVRLALTNLAAAGLLESAFLAGSVTTVQSRRRLLKRALAVGAVPTIVSVTAPAAAQSFSTGSAPICGTDNSCTFDSNGPNVCLCRCRFPLDSAPQSGTCSQTNECRYTCPV